jgi:RNA polymerase-binding transcription factor DksA
MTTAEVESYRRRLLAMKKGLGSDLSKLEAEAMHPIGGEAAGGLSDVPVHPADLSAENYEEEVTLDLLEGEERIMREINDALERIERGTFGRCENCHKMITKTRLDAIPYARYCRRCAKLLEGENRQ